MPNDVCSLRDWESVRIGNLQWRVRRVLWNPTIQTIMEDPDDFLHNRATILRERLSTTVGCAEGIVLKKYKAHEGLRRFKTHLRNLVRRSKCCAAFDKAQLLERAEIATPRVIAVAERRSWRLLRSCYLIMEEIPAALPLLQGRADQCASLEKVSEFIARLHEKGFSHRDLSNSNLIWDSKGQLCLLDLDALRHWVLVPDERAMLDLKWLYSQIATETRFSRKQRQEFLRHYCACRGREDWRWWWRQIASTPKRR